VPSAATAAVERSRGRHEIGAGRRDDVARDNSCA